jgi:hypothetical protein
MLPVGKMYECLRYEQLHEAFGFVEVVVCVGSRLDLLFFVVELFVVDFLASVVTFL